MKKILTVTFNPTIDAASEAETVRPTRKVRTFDESFHPGGGGVNVARIIHRLGGDVVALYACGGVMSNVLNYLMDKRGIRCKVITVEGNTRINNVIHERSTGMEYRFVAQGPILQENEWKQVIEETGKLEWDWLVISGSLPRGVPVTVYDTFIEMARKRGAEIALDTSGEALKYILKKGGLSLVKPSQGEFETSTGKQYHTAHEIAIDAQKMAQQGVSKIIAVTLGHQGAVLATADTMLYLASPPVRVISASGAGDSFVGGMVYALAKGDDIDTAFRLATACGTAAVTEKGTRLCQQETIQSILDQLNTRDTHQLSVTIEPE